MEFKIDTKTTYTVVTPVSNHLDANLAEALRQKWLELVNQGSKNLIVDLHNCLNTDENVFPALLQMHDTFYQDHQSLVFTQLQDEVNDAFKKHEIDLSLNIAPTMSEAADIVSMEILERDLFNEES